MGAGCVIVLWFCAAVAAGTFWLGCLLGFLFARRKKWRIASAMAGIPVVVIPLAGAAIGALLIFGAVRATIPRYVYQDAFGEAPSADVRHLRSRVWSFADSAHVFMRFEATRETFIRVASKNMEKVSFEEFKKRMPANNLSPPRWWIPPTQTTSEIYLRAPAWGEGTRFASESELITFDSATGTVTYFYIGID